MNQCPSSRPCVYQRLPQGITCQVARTTVASISFLDALVRFGCEWGRAVVHGAKFNNFGQALAGWHLHRESQAPQSPTGRSNPVELAREYASHDTHIL